MGKYPNWLKISKKQTKIIIYSSNNDVLLDIENPINIFAKDYQVAIETKNEYFDRIYQEPAAVLENPCGAFFLDVDEKVAKQIETEYGVICQSVKNIDDHCLLYSKEITSVVNKTNNNWSNFLRDIKWRPSNALIINDRYLFKSDDVVNENGVLNVLEIINSILPADFKADYHIMILFDSVHLKSGYSFSQLANSLNKKIKKLRPYSISFELISVKGNTRYHECTHNRRIITNYCIIRAEHKLNAFSESKSVCGQIINCDMLYSKGISDDSDCPINPLLKMIYDIKKIANYGKIHSTAGYEYALNGNTRVPISKMQNRLILYKIS